MLLLLFQDEKKKTQPQPLFNLFSTSTTRDRTRSPSSRPRWPRTQRPPGTAPSMRPSVPRSRRWRRGAFERDSGAGEEERERERERPRDFLLLPLLSSLLFLLASRRPSVLSSFFPRTSFLYHHCLRLKRRKENAVNFRKQNKKRNETKVFFLSFSY